MNYKFTVGQKVNIQRYNHWIGDYIIPAVITGLGIAHHVNKIRFYFKTYFFKLIRPFFVKDIDPNEDYNCMTCNEPVLRRYLHCSVKCSEEFDKIMG